MSNGGGNILFVFESWTLSDFKKDSLCGSGYAMSSFLSTLRVQESNTMSIFHYLNYFLRSADD